MWWLLLSRSACEVNQELRSEEAVFMAASLCYHQPVKHWAAHSWLSPQWSSTERSLLWQCEVRVSVASPRRPVFNHWLEMCCLTSLFLNVSFLLPLGHVCLTKPADSQILIWPRHILALEALSYFSHCTFLSQGGENPTKGGLFNLASERLASERLGVANTC